MHSVWLPRQFEAHVPPAQTCSGPHALPHAPQFLLSDLSFAQYGAPASGAHPISFGGQPPWHLPETHAWSGAQIVAQSPQCVLSVWRFVQIPASPAAHACCPLVQRDTHVPPEHKAVGSHALPHAPQLFWSFFVLTHVPLHDV